MSHSTQIETDDEDTPATIEKRYEVVTRLTPGWGGTQKRDFSKNISGATREEHLYRKSEMIE